MIDTARRLNRWAPVAESYERVTFELGRMHPDGLTEAALIAPGHPLLHAVIEATIEDLGPTLTRGTVLVDRRTKQADAPMLMFSVEQRVENSTRDTVSHHFDYPLLEQGGMVTVSAAPPYLDYDRPEAAEADAIAEFTGSDWARRNHEKLVRAGSYREGLQPRMAELTSRLTVETARVRSQVRERLLAEINHWDREYNRLEALERAGTIGRVRAETALARSRQLDERLMRRLAEFDKATNLYPAHAVIRGCALVIPSAVLGPGPEPEDQALARQTEQVERRAVDAVLAAERALGRHPEEMARNNPGYDIRSIDAQGNVYYLEVKGRIAGAETFTITTNEVIFAQTQGERHRLALVEVSPDGADGDQLRYVRNAFGHLEPSATTRSYNELWRDYWIRGGPAQ